MVRVRVREQLRSSGETMGISPKHGTFETGQQPTQANTECRSGTSAKLQGSEGYGTTIIDVSTPTTVVVHGGLCK